MKRVLTLLAVLLVAFSFTADAFARAGKSTSSGSRGSRTYDRPMERTITTPPPSTVAPAAPTAPTAQNPMYRPDAMGQQPGMAANQAMSRPGFFQRNPVMGGILGGMLGAGLFGMLFNSSAFASAGAAAPFANMLGMLFQFALIAGLVFLVLRFFRRKAQPQAAGHSHAGGYARQGYEAAPQAAAARVEKEFDASETDLDAFTDVILGVQASWSAGDPVKMRQFATPEMVSWMSEDLSRDASNGVRNVVEDVTLLKGDVVESWREEGREYITAQITFTAKDYMVRLDTGAVVEGSAHNPVEATERWTFVRSQGGRWLLSAIEQA